MKTVEILVGNIASFKSTYSLKRAREGAIVVSDDALTYALHGGDYKLYDKNLKPLYEAVRKEIIENALYYDKDVVIDRTNLSPQTRMRQIEYVKPFKHKNDKIVAVMFKMEEPHVHAERRFKYDNRGYGYEEWLSVAERMAKEYEPVTEEEGFDKIIHYETL